ncbi:MAG: helix-turn-helix transcriptional regulator [Microcoleus sp. SU_5_6]|nr:helix-turn-helix transcriptional regulator [Microcoleus sp. SU_5_6]NJL66230.1 helix-turn-helix transcriptional regulator [Microcoleus sp. SM1_3_4]
MSNIESPPSLLELAKKAGINDYKLKIGFREVFGTTVFGYLRNQRMEQARQLLLEQQMNVSEVAQTVGYASLSQFSTAFKHYFGITPKTYQKDSRSL